MSTTFNLFAALFYGMTIVLQVWLAFVFAGLYGAMKDNFFRRLSVTGFTLSVLSVTFAAVRLLELILA